MLWSKVDLDLYFRQCKGLQAQLKGLERTIRPVVGWGVYQRLSQLIAEMLVTLPLVQDLRDPTLPLPLLLSLPLPLPLPLTLTLPLPLTLHLTLTLPLIRPRGRLRARGRELVALRRASAVVTW